MVLALVTLVMVLFIVAGCGEAPKEAAGEAVPEEVVPAVGGAAKLGMGVITSIAKSKDAGDEVTALAQVDNIM
ncbi:MAG: hypothetical protein SCJ94_01745 [Bacillota bacterium]|nr:hypothetical protein [Bacillota bacterium]